MMNAKASAAPSAPDRAATAIHAVESVFVRHSIVEDVIARLKIVRAAGALGGTAKCFFLLGPSGAGKSQILRYFAAQYPRIKQEGFDEVPVLYVQMPVKATPKAVCEQILQELDTPLGKTGSLAELQQRVLKLLRGTKVQVMILDEFNHLIDAKTDKVQGDAANFVKALLNGCACPIVIAGVPETDGILTRVSQLRRRSMGRIDLKGFSWNNEADRKVFRAILLQFDKALPFPVRANLHEETMAQRILYATEGLLGSVAQLLIVAATIATMKQQDRLTNDCLAEAFDEVRMLDANMKLNPFRRSKLPELQIVETGSSAKR